MCSLVANDRHLLIAELHSEAEGKTKFVWEEIYAAPRETIMQEVQDICLQVDALNHRYNTNIFQSRCLNFEKHNKFWCFQSTLCVGGGGEGGGQGF